MTSTIIFVFTGIFWERTANADAQCFLKCSVLQTQQDKKKPCRRVRFSGNSHRNATAWRSIILCDMHVCRSLGICSFAQFQCSEHSAGSFKRQIANSNAMNKLTCYCTKYRSNASKPHSLDLAMRWRRRHNVPPLQTSVRKSDRREQIWICRMRLAASSSKVEQV